MDKDHRMGIDSRGFRGGTINGLPGEPAFTLFQHAPSSIPILIAAPHAGRAYSPALRQTMRAFEETALRLEDRLVDHIARRVAVETGASLLVAHAPRAMVDLNRGENEVDWSMVRGGQLKGEGKQEVSRRVRSGLGLIPRRVPGIGEIWRAPLEAGIVDQRLVSIHRPYHMALADELRRLRQKWGAALLIDLHSMPPIAKSAINPIPPKFVVGDRFGASCSGAIIALALESLVEESWEVAHNRPYAGGYVLDRHAAPRRDVHAFQLELCRSTYLDTQANGLDKGHEEVVLAVTRLVSRLGAEIAAMGGINSGRIAAE